MCVSSSFSASTSVWFCVYAVIEIFTLWMSYRLMTCIKDTKQRFSEFSRNHKQNQTAGRLRLTREFGRNGGFVHRLRVLHMFKFLSRRREGFCQIISPPMTTGLKNPAGVIKQRRFATKGGRGSGYRRWILLMDGIFYWGGQEREGVQRYDG